MNGKRKPLYEQVMDQLKARILEGEFDGASSFTTEDRIINEYEVSRITAIRALNELERENIIRRKQGKGSYVTRNAKQYIEQAAVRPAPDENTADRKIVAVVLPYNRNFGNLNERINGINAVLSAKGYTLSVYDAKRDVERQGEILRELTKQDVAGVICLPANSRDHLEIYNYYIMQGKPFLLLDQYIDCLPVKAVVSDNREGSRLLCDSFFDKGHRRIGYLTHGALSNATSVRDRYFGYVDSLARHGQTVNLEYVEINISDRSKRFGKIVTEKESDSGLSEEEKKNVVRDREEALYTQYMQETLLRFARSGVTAVLCQNDWVALEAAAACEKLGIRVPQQMEIGGFDNIPDLACTEYGKYISTVEQDFTELGRRAGRRFLEEAESGIPLSAGIDLVPVKLHIN